MAQLYIFQNQVLRYLKSCLEIDELQFDHHKKDHKLLQNVKYFGIDLHNIFKIKRYFNFNGTALYFSKPSFKMFEFISRNK